MDYFEYTPLELGAKIKEKEIGVKELTSYALDRVSALDDEIGAFLRVDAEKALSRADEVQKQIDNGELNHPLLPP